MTLSIPSRYCLKAGLLVVLCVATTAPALSTAENAEPDRQTTPHSSDSIAPWLLSPDQGLAIIGAALESRRPIDSSADCSNFVHAIYERAGFAYAYANSWELYRGAKEFRQVKHPQPGDLVVWRGHVGIVISPAQHSFFSAMRSGRGVEFYDSPYWRTRGQPRFFRHLKSAAPALSASMRKGNAAARSTKTAESRDPVATDANFAQTTAVPGAAGAPVEASKANPPAASAAADASPGATLHPAAAPTTADPPSATGPNQPTATRHKLQGPEDGVWEKTASKPSPEIPYASAATPVSAPAHLPRSRQSFAASNTAAADHPVARRQSEGKPPTNQSISEPRQMAMSNAVPRPPWSSAGRSNSTHYVPRPPAGWVPQAIPASKYP